MTKLENYQRLRWDVLYKNNNTNLYKDRHYIKFEFKELVDYCSKDNAEQSCLLDFGCGVGNGFFPLIDNFGYSKLRVNCCDISKTAISLVKKHPSYNQDHVKAF